MYKRQPYKYIMDETNKKERPRRRWADDLVDWCNKYILYLHPVWIGVGQEEVESFRKVCRGHQRPVEQEREYRDHINKLLQT